MIIDKNKSYRTRDGREVRIYATDAGGVFPVHGAVKSEAGWAVYNWTPSGAALTSSRAPSDLIEADPHGILPRHRELLAEAYAEAGWDATATLIKENPFEHLDVDRRFALIALARLDAERSKVEG